MLKLLLISAFTLSTLVALIGIVKYFTPKYPRTVGRFKIMYDKTMKFTTINGYKPFVYYKKISNICRNNSLLASGTGASTSKSGSTTNGWMTKERSPPVQKSAYYMMIYSDGLTFDYSTESSTPAASFHLFNRVAYYNN